MNFTTVIVGVAQKAMFFISDRQGNFFGISRTPIRQNTTSELKETFFIKYILQKHFYLNTIIFQYFAVRKITAPPAYGEIVELIPRPAYGMKDKENLDM